MARRKIRVPKIPKPSRISIHLQNGTKVEAEGPAAEQMARRALDPGYYFQPVWTSPPSTVMNPSTWYYCKQDSNTNGNINYPSSAFSYNASPPSITLTTGWGAAPGKTTIWDK